VAGWDTVPRDCAEKFCSFDREAKKAITDACATVAALWAARFERVRRCHRLLVAQVWQRICLDARLSDDEKT
jgi:hypothetical protein